MPWVKRHKKQVKEAKTSTEFAARGGAHVPIIGVGVEGELKVTRKKDTRPAHWKEEQDPDESESDET